MPPRDSRLPTHEKERFFRIWFSMLGWVNQQKNIVPGARPPYAVREAIPVRNAIWADDALRHAWISANPDGLVAEDLAIARSWDLRVAGFFTLAKHFAGFSLFLSSDGKAYAVLGLLNSLSDLVPNPPTYLQTVLLPFGDCIIYDGFLEGYAISLGPGIRRRITDEIRRAKERNAILTSLVPGGSPPTVDSEKVRKKANESVLKLFARHLVAEGHSEAVRARDVTVAEWIGNNLPADRTLSELRATDVQRVASEAGFPVPAAQALTALKRFTLFLARADRMTSKEADDLHRWLRAFGRPR